MSSEDSEASKDLPNWYLLKCGCKTFITDYPFVNCTKCGYINCGSSEELERAKKEGYLMETLETGYFYPDIIELKERHDLESIELHFTDPALNREGSHE